MTTTEFELLYDDFEGKFQRRPAARSLRDELLATSRSGVLPSNDAIRKLRERLSAESFNRCVADDIPVDDRPAECKHAVPTNCDNRCSGSYWLRHGEDVATNMKAIASFLGSPEEALWYAAAGLVHDIDYLRYPHHNALVNSSSAHPLTVVRALMKLGADSFFCLAILEHAPHTGLTPSTALSQALVACDEFSTITGFGEDPRFDSDIPGDLQSCLTRRSFQSIGGYVRPDMVQRLNASLRGLCDYRSWHRHGEPRPEWLIS